MNDEIKEKKTKRIIEKIEGLATYVTIPRELAIYNVNIDSQEAKLLIDYITNLQQQYEGAILVGKELNKENERLKEKSINEVLKNDFDMCVKDLKKANKKIEKLEDYKSRCEKAVEYIKKQTTDEDTGRDLGYSDNIDYEYLLNILNGRSDE